MYDVPVHNSEEKARDLWIFCSLCNGANIKDIAKLQYKNISKTAVTFLRSKTEQSTSTIIVIYNKNFYCLVACLPLRHRLA